MLGAALGFLRHNVYPARIFMGDSGAMLLGFVLAAIPLQGLLKTASIVTLFFPLLVLAVPILDTSFVVAKRLKYRQPVYVADRQHLHHRFVNIGFSQRRAAGYIWLWCATLARPPSPFASSARTSTASGIRGGRSSSPSSGWLPWPPPCTWCTCSRS